jgi:hypothetical protein
MTPATLARALGGIISGDGALAPAPGRGADDRSLRVKIDRAAADGFTVRSTNGVDPVECLNHVRRRLGLGPPASNGHADFGSKDNPSQSEGKSLAGPARSITQEAPKAAAANGSALDAFDPACDAPAPASKTNGAAPSMLRLKLRHAGYDPLPVNGKKPPMLEWEKKLNSNDDEIRLWDTTWQYALNTGVLAKFCSGIDIDIKDRPAAEAIEALAREHFGEHGDILVRIGEAPKRLIPLRTDEPFAKIVRNVTAPNGAKA